MRLKVEGSLQKKVGTEKKTSPSPPKATVSSRPSFTNPMRSMAVWKK